ncbi:Lrp/AsnC ligand binding domain-containing protein [Rhizobium tubonense]|uniref:Lrp/AsnC ligand binding domain-containing protein n=1 Tax=Rhizobium tubonense TaxID=484088 RepID=UPI001FCE6BD2|nr:Lrp/AsnC ligand binding domain-containing protein [Rhizobium tubonense]
MLLKVRTRDTQALEDLLERIHSIEGIKGIRSYIALSTYLERGPSPVSSERDPKTLPGVFPSGSTKFPGE